MDLTLIKDIGFPIVCAVAVAWFARQQATALRSAYESRISALEGVAGQSAKKLDELNKYIREDLAEIAKESHERERELIRMMRDKGERRDASRRHLDPTPAHVALADEDTERIAAERAERKGRK
jgi:uncharacterized coiled-coil protein SlyX